MQHGWRNVDDVGGRQRTRFPDPLAAGEEKTIVGVRTRPVVGKDPGYPADTVRAESVDRLRTLPLHDEIRQLVDARPQIPVPRPEDFGDRALPCCGVGERKKFPDQLVAELVVLLPRLNGTVRFPAFQVDANGSGVVTRQRECPAVPPAAPEVQEYAGVFVPHFFRDESPHPLDVLRGNERFDGLDRVAAPAPSKLAVSLRAVRACARHAEPLQDRGNGAAAGVVAAHARVREHEHGRVWLSPDELTDTSVNVPVDVENRSTALPRDLRVVARVRFIEQMEEVVPGPVSLRIDNHQEVPRLLAQEPTGNSRSRSRALAQLTEQGARFCEAFDSALVPAVERMPAEAANDVHEPVRGR